MLVLIPMLLIDEFNVDEHTPNRMGMFTKYHDPNWAVGRCYVDTLEAWVAVLSQQEIQAIYGGHYDDVLKYLILQILPVPQLL